MQEGLLDIYSSMYFRIGCKFDSSPCMHACSVYATDPAECVRQCQTLLDEPKLDTAVRTGDVYGLLIEHFAQAGDYKEVQSMCSTIHGLRHLWVEH